MLSQRDQQSRRNSPASSSDPLEDPDIQHLLPGEGHPRGVDVAKDLNGCFRPSVANNADKVITNVAGNVHIASDFNSSVHKSSFEGGSDTHSGIHRSRSSPDRNADNCMDGNIIFL